jgi:hypothetical protein
MYFKRDARPKRPVDFCGLSEAEAQAAVKALTYEQVDQAVKDLRSREIVQNKKLHQSCVDRKCRRARACTADDRCCVCLDVAGLGSGLGNGLGRRKRKRLGALRRRRRMRI